MDDSNPHIFCSKDLEAFAADLLVRHDMTTKDAEVTARVLIEADMRGVVSHGLTRLPHYLQRLRDETIDPRATPTQLQVTSSLGLIDGHGAMGQVVMHAAADLANELAGEYGSGWVAVRNANHCGALPAYTRPLTEAGKIAVALTHTEAVVLPFGGRTPFLGTNPLCIAVPSKRKPGLCLDMATSIVAWNKVVQAQKKGESLPLGWAVDEAGNDTTDADAVRALHAFGGHKGSGLALMLDILSGALSNASFSPDIAAMDDMNATRRLGGLVGAIDVTALMPVQDFTDRIDDLLEQLGKIAPVNEGQGPYYPGELEQRSYERCKNEGIELPPHTWQALAVEAERSGVSMPATLIKQA